MTASVMPINRTVLQEATLNKRRRRLLVHLLCLGPLGSQAPIPIYKIM